MRTGGFLGIVFLLVSATTRGVGADCGAVFGADRPAVEAVQRYWTPAVRLMSDGRYADARAQLLASERLLPSIGDRFTRACVAGGADALLSDAIVGENYLRVHEHDLAGAKAAVAQNRRNFPVAHNCP